MRDYTPEEMDFLKQHEKHFECAIVGHWYRNLDRKVSEQIYNIHRDATGWNTRYNPNCGGCMLELLTAVGTQYYKQRDAQRAKVEVKEVPTAKAEKRIKVQTKKKCK